MFLLALLLMISLLSLIGWTADSRPGPEERPVGLR
jgi:hypothetical protein